MKRITIYFEQDSKDRDFKEGVQLLIENDKVLKANQQKFLQNEAKKNNPSKVAIQLLEARLHRLLRIDGQTPKKNESEKSDNLTSAQETDKTGQKKTEDTNKTEETTETGKKTEKVTETEETTKTEPEDKQQKETPPKTKPKNKKTNK